MTEKKQMEELIIESVIKELAKRGVMDSEEVNLDALTKVVAEEKSKVEVGEEKVSEDDCIEVPDISGVWIENAANPEALEGMKKKNPLARICLGRAGTRRKTNDWLRLLADHATARDAVFMDVSDEVLEKNGLFAVETTSGTKDEFLKNPTTGTKLSDEAINTIVAKCEKNPQVQIIVCDGLSSTAIESNLSDILPAVMQGLKAAGISVGTPFFIKNGRVRVMDHVGEILQPDVVLQFIGERPGLGNAESMSAYLCYKPNKNTVEADRTMISNIRKGGTPPAEAGAQLVDLIKNMLKYQASGIELNKKLK